MCIKDHGNDKNAMQGKTGSFWGCSASCDDWNHYSSCLFFENLNVSINIFCGMVSVMYPDFFFFYLYLLAIPASFVQSSINLPM